MRRGPRAPRRQRGVLCPAGRSVYVVSVVLSSFFFMRTAGPAPVEYTNKSGASYHQAAVKRGRGCPLQKTRPVAAHICSPCLVALSLSTTPFSIDCQTVLLCPSEWEDPNPHPPPSLSIPYTHSTLANDDTRTLHHQHCAPPTYVFEVFVPPPHLLLRASRISAVSPGPPLPVSVSAGRPSI